MTHTARRKQEQKEFKNLPTCNRHNIEGQEERFYRTDQGLWISAAETNEDWLISYDCQGLAVTSWMRMDITADESVESMAEKNKSMDPWNQEFNRNGVSKGNQDPRGKCWRVMTSWAEETPGRREIHVFIGLAPPSPLHSLPHSPVSARLPAEHVSSLRRSQYQGRFENQYRLKGPPEKKHKTRKENPGELDKYLDQWYKVPYAPVGAEKDAAYLSSKLSGFNEPGDKMTLPDFSKCGTIPSHSSLRPDGVLAYPARDGFTRNMLREINIEAPPEDTPTSPGETEGKSIPVIKIRDLTGTIPKDIRTLHEAIEVNDGPFFDKKTMSASMTLMIQEDRRVISSGSILTGGDFEVRGFLQRNEALADNANGPELTRH